MDLYLTAAFGKLLLCKKTLNWRRKKILSDAAECSVVTWSALAVIFVQLHQNRRGDHQEVSE